MHTLSMLYNFATQLLVMTSNLAVFKLTKTYAYVAHSVVMTNCVL